MPDLPFGWRPSPDGASRLVDGLTVHRGEHLAHVDLGPQAGAVAWRQDYPEGGEVAALAELVDELLPVRWIHAS